MKRALVILLLIVGSQYTIHSQQKKITLEALWSGEFLTEGMEVLRSSKNGQHYTILNFDKDTGISTIDKYAYETLEKTEIILSSQSLPEIPFFSSYEFSKDESKILLATEIEPIYRHSKLGIYYVYDLDARKLHKVADDKIQEPAFSPNGEQIAYVQNNNLYIYTLANNTTLQLTEDGERNSIINGIADWVYEEEFSFVRAFQWNSDGTRIAFLRFDEKNVPYFSMDVYGSALYPAQYVFKYPKAGEENARVSLHMLDVSTGSISEVAINDAYYIPRIQWMNHPDYLSIQTLNRHQNHLRLLEVQAQDNTVRTLMEEKDPAYVEITDNLTFLADDSFIWTSERDGYNHIYLFDADGKLMNQVTKGSWEVTQYYGYDQSEDRVYFQATENGSINRDVYNIRSNGKQKRKLSELVGTNDAEFNEGFTYFINTFSNATTPPKYTLHEADKGVKVKDIKDNQALLNKLASYEISPKEFSTIKVNGADLNMWMVKPQNFDSTQKYPLLLFQYSGPGSQEVANTWMNSNDYWHQVLASEGYIVGCVDGRGTGFKGRDFKKMTYLELGKYEVEDQIEAAKILSDLPYIDVGRTGIWGWSYGGFMATNCLLKGNDTFETAIAVAPVTNWRFYDTIYTERFMRTPEENPGGYDENSPINYPDLLQGNYLLVHGSGDDNVHVQNSMRMVEALIQANKQFDWAIYPDKNHGIYGGNTRLQLYTKMTNFLKDKL